MPDYFTRAEAEALLPRITPMLRQIQELRREQTAHDEAVAADRAKVIGNGHMPAQQMLQHQMESASARRQINRLVRALGEMGIVLKDFDAGLVDFPALRDNREVYLCWQLGEPRIAWWHETSAGFAGRTPLTDDEE
jgi:hypothetical protein